ncbi:hypothetical protein OEA41_001700 [Lepraria neglecta]|uniref:Uncharacterized protein n=1 Tax=Lepraria neglecta TaxID=209136 RepID=A0AAD9ZA33_9LECA|nr:hypothetical protein OEA41_001700 [Lepraria neglecta]
MITKHFGERKSQADLADLWMNIRNFCKIFKEEVEEIFRKEHLQKTWLHLGNDEQQISHEIHRNGSKHEHRQVRELRFDFGRFDLDNGGVAVFTLDKKHNFWR